MKVTGTYAAFKEYLSHRPDLAVRPFLIQDSANHQNVTDVLVNSIHWSFPPGDQPTVMEFRRWAVSATVVNNWTL